MPAIFRNTWSVLLHKEKKKFRLLVLADILISLLDLASLALLLLIVRNYLDPGAKHSLTFDAGSGGWIILPIFFIFFLLKNFAAYLISSAHHRFQEQVALRLSAASLEAFQEGTFRNHVNGDASLQLRKIAFQPYEFCQYHLSGLQQLITQSFLVLATIIAVLVYDPVLFFLLLAALGPAVLMIFYHVRKKLGGTKQAIRQSNEASFRTLIEAVHGYVESNIYNCHRFFRERFLEQRKIFGAHLFHSMSIQNLPARFIEVFAVMGIFLIIGISQWMQNETMLLTVGAFLAAAYKIIPGTVRLVNVSGQMRAHSFEFETVLPKHVIPFQETIQEMEFRNVSFAYGDKQVIRQLNFTVRSGDFIGVEGRSGIGKTTLLNLLLGFIEPQQGRIFFNRKIPEPSTSWWNGLSYVKQQCFLVQDTLERNIILHDRVADTGKLKAALEISGLSDFCKQQPEGLQFMIAEEGKNISGGQQQRIALARALYRDPQVMVLDEAFNELDEATVHTLLEYFRQQAAKGRIVIMVTHDQESLSWCNKIISLDD